MKRVGRRAVSRVSLAFLPYMSLGPAETLTEQHFDYDVPGDRLGDRRTDCLV